MIAITDKGELIPIKRGQSLTGMGFLGIIITNPDDIADDEYSTIGNRFNKPHSEQLQQEIINLLTKGNELIQSTDSETINRKLVVKRHPTHKQHLILCDEETDQPLSGQYSVVMESKGNAPAKITVEFDAWGEHGVHFEDDLQSK